MMYICTQCNHSFTKFKHLRTHWEECISPTYQPVREPINPMDNMWLNEDPYPQHPTSRGPQHPAADDPEETTCGKSETTCGNAGHPQISGGSYMELTMTLLDAVEKLTNIVLGERPNAATINPQSPPNVPSTSSPKRIQGTWHTVPGERKPVSKPARSTIECHNSYDPLKSLPIEDRAFSDSESTTAKAPMNTWGNSQPIGPKHCLRPQVVINEKASTNNGTYRKTIPGNNSFAGAVKHGKKVAIFSDSICNRMGKKQLRTELNCDVNKKSFPGTTTDKLYEHYMLPTH